MKNGLNILVVVLAAAVPCATAWTAEIHDAARAGDVARMKQLLANKPQLVNARDDAGFTPLHWAAWEGQEKLAELLVSLNADINAADEIGKTPLHRAAELGKKDRLELAVGAGSSQDPKDKAISGALPLDKAVLAGHAQVARLLLAHNADVHAKDFLRRTPLHRAAETGAKEIVELLLVHKADVNAKDAEGFTPLDLAKDHNQCEVAKLLCDHGGITIGSHARDLVQAVQAGELALVRQLLAKEPVVVNETGGSGFTSLHWAVNEGRKDMVELLLANKANANATSSQGGYWTPLHFAAFTGRKDIAELLLAHKADINAKAEGDLTPLHRALEQGENDMAKLLVVHGASVNVRNEFGRTPLHLAAAGDSKDLIRLLLAHKADINAKDGVHGLTPLHYAARDRKDAAVEELLAHKADVNSTDREGYTPLHTVLRRFNIPFCGTSLLLLNIDWKKKNAEERTAQMRIVKLLLANRADINAKNKEGNMPLDVATAEGEAELVTFLRQHGGKSGKE